MNDRQRRTCTCGPGELCFCKGFEEHMREQMRASLAKHLGKPNVADLRTKIAEAIAGELCPEQRVVDVSIDEKKQIVRVRIAAA